MKNIHFFKVLLTLSLLFLVEQKSPAADCVQPPSGLVSWWTGQSDGADIIGNNSGTLRNGVQIGVGKVGNAFQFSGNNFVEIPSRTNLIPTGSFSIEAWIFPTQAADQAIFSKWSDSTGRAYVFGVHPGNGLRFGISDTAHQDDPSFHLFDSTNNVVPLNAWSHVAAVYDQATGKRLLYVNGVKVAERTDAPITIFTSTNAAAIGGRLATSTAAANLFTGSIDEVSFYNRVLTASEITSVYNALNAGKCIGSSTSCVTPPSQMVSWWAGEDNATDLVGTNSGSIRNGAQFVTGKVGKAFQFNGSNQFVEIPSSPSLLPTGSFSIEAWIRPTQSADQSIFAKWSNAERSYSFSLTGGNGLLFAISDAAHQDDGSFHDFTSSNNVVPLNAWSHVAAVYNQATGKRLLYVNGVKVAERTDASVTIFNTTIQAAIGARLASPTQPANLFTGFIDEVSFYNRALTDADVASVFNAQSAGKCATSQPTAPRITQAPQDQAVPIGGVIDLSVTATGTPPLAYQWLFKGAALPGQTNATLRITNAQATNSGQYTVIISNSVGNPALASATVTVSGECIAPPAGLISWWPGGGDASDRIGGNVGVLKNGVLFASGKVGQAFSLNGINQYVEITNSASLSVTGSHSIEAWVYPTQAADQAILAKWSNNQRSYVLSLTPANGLRFGISDTAHQLDAAFHAFDSPPDIVPLNAWSHVAAVYNQSNGVRQIFLNGVKVAERTDAPITILSAPPNLAIGARMADVNVPTQLFNGKLDEVSFYGRPLLPEEIFAVYNAGAAGKCPSPVAPFIITQPLSQTRTVGTSAVFTVSSAGSAPFYYQWYFNGTALTNATNSTLTITNVQTTNAGPYYAVVSNILASATSSNATLTVQLPPSALQVGNVTATNGVAIVPVRLVANGAENSVSFSLSFATNRLTFDSAALGAAVAQQGGSLIVANTNQASIGRLGFAIAMPGNQTFLTGTNLLLSLTFRTAPVSSQTSSTISFSDTPIGRVVAGVDGASLTTTYTSGAVTIPFLGIESDVVTPDNQVSTADWQAVGRMVVGLDVPATALIFQKADAAPRTTFGNGYITVGDWAQASRYLGGLDPATGVGGPSVNLGSELPLTPAQVSSARNLRVVNVAANPGATVQVPIELNALGGENGVAFSLLFDPGVLAISRVTLGTSATSAILVVNTNQGNAGRVGVALALPAGQTFTAGVRQVAVAEFVTSKWALGEKVVSFANRPAIAEVSDAAGAALPTAFTSGSVSITANPTNAPFAPLILGTINDFGAFVSGNLTTDPTVVLTGLSQPGTTVTVSFRGDGTILFGQALADTNGIWTLDWNRQFSLGTNVFSAVASNDSGLNSAVSDDFALTIAMARLSNLTRSPTGVTQLTLEGTVGLNYRLQVSHDLAAWGDLTSTRLTNSTAILTDPTNTTAQASFYRVRVER